MTGHERPRSDDERGRSSGGRRPEPSLASRLSDLARYLQAEPELQLTLDAIVHAAVINVPGATHAGITRVDRRGTITTEAATDDQVRAIDLIQYEVRQGPCLSAIWDQATLLANDLRSDDRWPLFASRAADAGAAAMLSFQLFVRDTDLGALNLYAEVPNAFVDSDEQIGLLLASHAAVAMIGARQQHHLRAALTHRDVIGQAKGILMERYQISADQAFGVLLRLSQSTNRKLHEIAEELAQTRQVPTD